VGQHDTGRTLTPPARRRLIHGLAAAEELERRRAIERPGVFARRYLPHYLKAPPAAFHRELFDLMAADGPRRHAFAAPRGHAKSTLVTLVFVLWAACTGRRRFILLVSDTETQAEMFLADVRRELEDNDLLRRDFGDLVGPVWRQGQILTRRGVRIVARGTGSALRGLRSGSDRPDLIVCDDLENDENAATPEQRRKIGRWFRTALLNTLDPDGEVWVIGTILHHDSLLANLVGGNPERGVTAWPGKVYRALDDDGNALWPALWPPAALAARKREIGSIAFAQEFQNDPADRADRLFRGEWLERPEIWYEQLPPGLEFYQAVDPAIGASAAADYFCLMTLGLERGSGNLYVADIVRDHLTFDRQVAAIIERAARFQPVLIGIETVAYQQGLADAVRARAPLPLESIRPTRDKVARAMRLSAIVENAKLRLRRGDSRMDALREELLLFPHGAHDDQVDALGYAAALAVRYCGPRMTLL